MLMPKKFLSYYVIGLAIVVPLFYWVIPGIVHGIEYINAQDAKEEATKEAYWANLFDTMDPAWRDIYFHLGDIPGGDARKNFLIKAVQDSSAMLHTKKPLTYEMVKAFSLKTHPCESDITTALMPYEDGFQPPR